MSPIPKEPKDTMDRLANLRGSKYLRVQPRPTRDFAVYHAQLGGLCVVDAPLALLLRSSANDGPTALGPTQRFPAGFLEAFAGTFEARGFLVPRDRDEPDHVSVAQEEVNRTAPDGVLAGVVQLVLTNRCNLSCEYCFTNSIYTGPHRSRLQQEPSNQTMPPGEAVAYLENVVRFRKERGGSHLAVQFFGGEPLVNWKAAEAVLDHFGDGARHGLAITYSIVTNGTLVDERVADRLRDHRVSTVVSFDSPRSVHRRLVDGRNSVDVVVKALRTLRSKGVPVALNAVLAQDTFDYFDRDMVDCAVENGVGEIGVLLDLDPDFFQKRGVEAVVQRLMNVYAYARERKVILSGYWKSAFDLMRTHQPLTGRAYKTCSGTGAQLSIEPSGHVFACKGSSGYYGHVGALEGVLASETYRRHAGRSIRNSPACVTCDVQAFCSGFCLGPLEKRYGDIAQVEPAACGFYRRILEELVACAERDEVPHFFSPPEVANAFGGALPPQPMSGAAASASSRPE